MRAQRQAVDARGRRAGRQRPGAAEQPALAERRADGARPREVLLGLDPLGEQDRAGALGLGGDGVEHARRDRRGAARLDQGHVELDHVGREERHQRERALVDADVVERDPAAALAQPRDGGEHLGRAVGERALGELDDHAQAPGAQVGLVGQRRVVAQHGGGLDVDEQRERRRQLRGERALDGGAAARAVELGDEPELVGGAEQRARGLQRRALRPAGERLVGDGDPGVEVDDRLVERTHAAAAEQLRERAGDRGRRGEGRHAGAIGRCAALCKGPVASADLQEILQLQEFPVVERRPPNHCTLRGR